MAVHEMEVRMVTERSSAAEDTPSNYVRMMVKGRRLLGNQSVSRKISRREMPDQDILMDCIVMKFDKILLDLPCGFGEVSMLKRRFMLLMW